MRLPGINIRVIYNDVQDHNLKCANLWSLPG